jgi:hypothetical protein
MHIWSTNYLQTNSHGGIQRIIFHDVFHEIKKLMSKVLYVTVHIFIPLTLKHHGAIILKGGIRSGGGGVT